MKRSSALTTDGKQLALTGVGELSIEKACAMLAECKGIDEAKNIADVAAAMLVYRRKKNAGLEARNHAAEIMLRAERRIGELADATPLHKGGRPRKTGGENTPVSAPTLEDLGLTKEESRRARKLASVPMTEFNNRLVILRNGMEKITAAAVAGKGVKEQSKSEQDLRTPRWFFDFLNDMVEKATGQRFALDAFASLHNALCSNYCTKETNGLAQPWKPNTFANPEFDDMEPVFAKAVDETKQGFVACIVGPIGCSQAWHHKYCIKGTVFHPDCRINFDKQDGTPTDKADRDTQVTFFGGPFTNLAKHGGVFRLRALEVKHLRPKREAA